MIKIGLLGCGKIGTAILNEIQKNHLAEVIFIQEQEGFACTDKDIRIIHTADEDVYREADLIIESATKAVLENSLDLILKHCDLLMFSVTAFAEKDFEDKVGALQKMHGRKIYIPHGAILGLDGIFDGKDLWKEVHIVTKKSPASLGRDDVETKVIFDGITRDACKLYPRNVNVHAAIALSGIGFDKTYSTIISCPSVNYNSHEITVISDDTTIKLEIRSTANGSITGSYTPVSAIGSVRRLLNSEERIRVI